MKRLFSASLILLVILFSSCVTEKKAQEEDSVERMYNAIYASCVAGDWPDVIRSSDEALSVYPRHTRFLKTKALALRETGQKKEYVAALEEIIRREPYDESLRNLYLDTLVLSGEKEKALSFSEKTIILFPENMKALSVLKGESGFYSYLFKEISGSQV